MGKVVLVTGGFDPLHSGHIAYFKAARELGDHLVVGLNSDDWLTRKKGASFMPFSVRKNILESIKYIDFVYPFDDSDDTAIDLINDMNHAWGDVASTITFGNGGDRKDGNYPELEFCRDMNILIDDDIGGTDKVNSSSNFLAKIPFKKPACAKI